MNCLSCLNGPICAQCNPGAYLNLSDCNNNFIKASISCGTCNAFCSICVDGPKCTLCLSNYYLDFSTSNPLCKTDNRSCVSCSFIPNCRNCVHGPKCTACNLHHVLDYASRKMFFIFKSTPHAFYVRQPFHIVNHVMMVLFVSIVIQLIF